jgi:hypothetical protein
LSREEKQVPHPRFARVRNDIAGKISGMNYLRWVVTLCFFLEENIYFGWHLKPKSDAELIADGILFLLLAMATRGDMAPVAVRETKTGSSPALRARSE